MAHTIRSELNIADITREESLARSRRTYMIYHLIAWGIPLLISITLFGARKSAFMEAREGWYCGIKMLNFELTLHCLGVLPSVQCLLLSGKECYLQCILQYFRMVPLFISIAWNVILYFVIFRQIHKTYSSFTTEKNFMFRIQRRLRYLS
jgi:hypothetical protein